MAKLDFCCCCGDWIGANAGTIRLGPDGEGEIICDGCLAIEQNTISATLNDEQKHRWTRPDPCLSVPCASPTFDTIH